MKAYLLKKFGTPLALVDIDKPHPKETEVLIKVRAVSVNPVDIAFIDGQFIENATLPVVLGSDVAGEVVKIGTSASGLSVGDRVAGLINFPGTDGTLVGRGFAEYVAVPANQIAILPKQVSFEQAAAASMVGLTAWQVIEAADVRPGQRVLIQGGSGGVGHIALQLAKSKGAYVIATGSASNLDFMRGLGADEVIDYGSPGSNNLPGVDTAVVPWTDGRALRTIEAVKDGGTLIVLWPITKPVEEAAKAKNLRLVFVGVRSSAKNMASLLELSETRH